MTLRLSTQSLYMQGLNSLLGRQAEIARTRQQISSGVKLTQGKDDPVGMATAQRLDHMKAALTQYDSNAQRVDHRLRMQENALIDANDSLTRARELAIQANSGAMSSEDRKAIATEVLQLRRNLLDIANRDDGNGRRLFAGTRDGVLPFTDNAGSVIYHGDDGRNAVEVGPDVAIEDGAPGSAVFLRVRTGDGYARGSAGTGNTGSGQLERAQATDGSTWNGSTLTLRFTAPNAYEIVDAGGNPLTPPVTGSWASGDVVPPAAAGLGVEFKLSGSPAAGDTFSVETAPNQDVFATLQAFADALLLPGTTPADNARRVNAFGSAIGDITTAQGHMLAQRAGVGARMNDIDTANDGRSLQSLTLSESLASLRETNLAEAISRLNMQLLALEAAQKTMLQTQGMSLFNTL